MRPCAATPSNAVLDALAPGALRSLRVRVLRPLRPSSCCPSCSCLSSCGAAPGRASSSCGSRRRSSPPSDSAGPRAGSGSTSSKPWGRGTLPAGEGPRRETQGEVLITVDGAPRDCGRRWWSGTTRRRDRRGATAGQDRPSSRWRSCWQQRMRRRLSGFYQPFPWSVIAPIEADRWALDAGDVLGGLEVGGRLGRTTSSTWRWTRVVRAGCLGTQRICPAAVRPPCRSSPLRAAPRLFPVFVRRTRPWRASSSCGFRRRASGVAAGRFRGPSSGLQVDFEHAWGRGTLPVDEDPGARDGRAGS